jgi:hypothetical protein
MPPSVGIRARCKAQQPELPWNGPHSLAGSPGLRSQHSWRVHGTATGSGRKKTESLDTRINAAVCTQMNMQLH